MCGIMGYVGQRQASEILLDGLTRLEYRGYDSSGLAIYRDEAIHLVRAKGKLARLEEKLREVPLQGSLGIGHTRWATHGKPSDENAHPHRSEHVVVVHNGIIENHLELRKKLIAEGYAFHSETDTEVFPNLVEYHMRLGKGLEKAVRDAIREVRGAFAFAVVSAKEPDKIVVAKNSSPLILGIGNGENYLASDIPALLSYTRNVVILEDGEIAVITKESWKITDFEGNTIERKPKHITWSRVMAEKGGYKHFMLKEIHEQPTAIADTLRSRVLEASSEISLDEVKFTKEQVAQFQRVLLLACGTSYHAALVAKFWIERLAQIPVEVDLASEFRYRAPVINENVLCIPISQSGETADTLAALEEAKRLGAKVLSICNVVDSTIARKSDAVFYSHAGPEIGVASTKAFTTQLACLAMIAVYLGKERGILEGKELQRLLHSLIKLPIWIESALQTSAKIQSLVPQLAQARHALFLGRGSSYPIALEGALKLKEISYIHAEGYAGGEMKHGPIALVDDEMPVVALASGGPVYPKMVSNLEEVRARGGKIIAIVAENDEQSKTFSDEQIEIPSVDDFVRPIVEVIPLQLMAYFVADHRGTDVDQPRNLAKSVTVE